MILQVIEGRLTETPAGPGVERRAFGEFVGPHGELASYAFGWTTGPQQHAARFTVGIGAGNPGGGTFHAIAFDRRARWMKHWLLGTTSIQTGEVFERREPILYVGHDAGDGLWQLIGPSDADPATGRLVHLHHAVEHDPTLLDVLDLEPGAKAYRTGPGAPWTGEPS